MNIHELIDACGGPEAIGVQFLDHCLLDAQYHHKKGTKITFGTDAEISPKEGTKELGMIVWLDRDLVRAALAKSETENPDG